jgi:alpha-ketoglutarate-dependent taurine dioxygenase
VDVKPFEGYDFGADVTGLDLDAPVDSAVVDNLRCALDEYQLLVFRNEAIPSPEAQISLVGTFGPVGDELGDGRRWSTVASDVREMVRPRHRLLFHSDYSFCQWPFPVISLCTLVVQGDVVPTKFSSARGAYERLQPDLRKAVKDLTIVMLVRV